MPSLFHAWSTAEEVAVAHEEFARGRIFLVTGASAGLGFETARALASVGGRVFVATRSQASAENTVARLRAALGAKGATAELIPLELNLSSLASVERSAAAFLAQSSKLDCLINNAGVMASSLTKTDDGLEEQWGVNHVAHALLTERLLPALASSGTPERPARVVNLSSMGNWLFALPEGIAFDRLAPDAATYSRWSRYSETKLANILHALELTKRCAASKQNVVGVACHPGSIMGTSLTRHASGAYAADMLSGLWSRGGGRLVYAFTKGMKTVRMGAAPAVFCALEPTVQSEYYGYHMQVERHAVHALAHDPELAKTLWEKTGAQIKAVLSPPAKGYKTANNS